AVYGLYPATALAVVVYPTADRRVRRRVHRPALFAAADRAAGTNCDLAAGDRHHCGGWRRRFPAAAGAHTAARASLGGAEYEFREQDRCMFIQQHPVPHIEVQAV